MADYNKAIFISPKFAEPYCYRAIIYRDQGKHGKAVTDFRQFLKLVPNDPRVPYIRKYLINYEQRKPRIKKSLESATAEGKIYVSTVGMAIRVKEGDALADFQLYKIESQTQENRLMGHLTNYIDDTDPMYAIFNRILSVRNYNVEHCYVLMSPKTKNIEIKQPYHYKNQDHLVFDVLFEKKLTKPFVYFRVYIVSKTEDKFDKYLLIRGQKIKLKLGKLKKDITRKKE